MRKRLLLIAVLMLTAALVLAACDDDEDDETSQEPVAQEPAEEPAAEEPAAEEPAAEEPAAEEPEPLNVKIGFMGPLTGGAAFLGSEQMGFAKVAIDIFNEDADFSVELVEFDTEIDPDVGIIGAERFVADDDILAVVGPSGSQVCEATQPFYEEAGLVHISPSCTRISLTDPGTPTFFRPIPHDGLQGPTVGTYMIDVLGAGSAYLVDDQSSYSTGLTDEVEKALNGAGVSDVERASVTQDDTDFSSLVTDIIAANSDVVFFPGQISSQLGLLVVQLREQGYEGDYFLGDGGFDISWVETAGDAADGSYLTFFAPDPHLVPEASAYNDAYQSEFGDFGAFGGPSALAANIALGAIQRCVDAGDVTRECVRDEVAATDIANSMLGFPVSFASNGDPNGGSFPVFQVQGSDFALVQ